MEGNLPEAGDIFWVELDPVAGAEQASRRPAIILSTRLYHEASRRAVVCPITSNMRPWPFKVILPSGLKTVGAVLVDQIRAIDRGARVFAFVEASPPEVLSETVGKLAALLGIPRR